jgi:adenosylmethionine-8-amino-7-oxononanoate aminotransferase
MTTIETGSGALFTLDPTRAYPVLTHADGIRVWDRDGRAYLDAIAGIAVANVGYGRAEVVDAMAAQAARLPFAVGNIWSTEPAIELASEIARHTPGDLDHVSFTSGGSEAVDVALKMARQYHVLRGEPDRSVFVSRWTNYHGATLGGLTVGGSKLRRKAYEPLLLDTPHVRTPYCYRCPWPESHPDCGEAAAAEVEAAIIASGPERVAAVIGEPIIASVGGAIPPQPDYWPRVREICDRHGVLLILDEVVTGFGRTGRRFAADHWSVVPDLLVMGKGVSGGYAPLGAVAARRHVRAIFEERGAAFEHIFTFGGHPVSTAAGLAVLRIWERERLTERAASLEAPFRAALDRLREHPFVGDVRVTGLMAGIELVADRGTKEPFEPSTKVGARIREAGLRNGIVTYPGSGMADGTRGDVISLYPPLIVDPADIVEIAERLDATFAEVGRDIQS